MDCRVTEVVAFCMSQSCRPLKWAREQCELSLSAHSWWVEWDTQTLVKTHCYGLNHLPRSWAENWSLSVTGLRSGALGGRSPSLRKVLREEVRSFLPFCLLPCADTMVLTSEAPSWKQRAAPARHQTDQPYNLGLTSRVVRNKFLLLINYPDYDILL
jgi:hypothetical protein